MPNQKPINTSDIHTFNRAWKESGGSIVVKNATGELLYSHPRLIRQVRTNGRRKDTVKKLLSCYNQISKSMLAANDPIY